MTRLAGKVAVVTGGAAGIGAAIAAGYAREGAMLVIADLSLEKATAIAGSLGGGAFGLEVDISSQDSVEAMADQIIKRVGRVDILVNNAGVTRAQPWFKITAEAFDRIFAVNVRGLVFVTQALAVHMVKQGRGSIINLTSGAGRRGLPLNGVYAASKAAIISLTQSSALAFAESGVRVNAIAPGGVITPMWHQSDEEISRQLGQPKGRMAEEFTKMIPMGRIGLPEDYVGVATFLACEDSAYMTGQILSVDGGLWMG